MAKAKMIKVKALANLKYDKECVSINKEFKSRVEDAKEMVQKGYVELLEEIPEEIEENQDGEGETSKEGE